MATSTTPPLVLVVDDSWTELTWMANALQANGYRVITANDGDEALAKVLAERPDCVILDVVLPKQNGFQVCRRLKQQAHSREIPVILISVKQTPTDQQWGLQQGAALYLPKPFSPEVLVQSVKRVL